MSKKAIRVIVSVVIIGGALSALLATTTRDNAQYYKYVDEVMPVADQWHGKTLKLHGYVVDGSIGRRPDTLDYRFQVKHGDSVVTASYTGVVPDTFKDGSEVVLTGRLDPHGFQVEKDGIMAKCPSKYEEAPGPVLR